MPKKNKKKNQKKKKKGKVLLKKSTEQTSYKTSAFKKNKNVDVIKGGNERPLSSKKALYHIKNNKVDNVFIHDAARPNFSLNLLKNLNQQLKKNQAVVPYINTENSAKYSNDNKIFVGKSTCCFY